MHGAVTVVVVRHTVVVMGVGHGTVAVVVGVRLTMVTGHAVMTGHGMMVAMMTGHSVVVAVVSGHTGMTRLVHAGMMGGGHGAVTLRKHGQSSHQSENNNLLHI